MNRLALRMLFGDTSKYLMLISGITFATLLMCQGAALFCGLMTWTFAPLRNTPSRIHPQASPNASNCNTDETLGDLE